MLGEKLQVALSKSAQDVVVRPATDGSLRQYKGKVVVKGSQTTRADDKSYTSHRYSDGSRRVRRVRLGGRGLKQDTLSSNQFSKRYDAFTTTYGKDYGRNGEQRCETSGSLPGVQPLPSG